MLNQTSGLEMNEALDVSLDETLLNVNNTPTINAGEFNLTVDYGTH
jgi:hypothetical protein